ncbi:MAG: lasso peptide biosynthesis B2 protein [Defluviitaleaceae bacterium]|nr:lasso peptide biosynthesis B2 protein [Defluviitaleaceae bacterium]
MFKEYSHDSEGYPLIDYSSYSEQELLMVDNEMNNWIIACMSTCRFLPFEAQCIHQSFFLYSVIREKYGLPVSLVIGTCPFPFSAHAWIMLGDENFFEADYETSKYNVMLRSENFHEVG